MNEPSIRFDSIFYCHFAMAGLMLENIDITFPDYYKKAKEPENLASIIELHEWACFATFDYAISIMLRNWGNENEFPGLYQILEPKDDD